jgi:phosphoribosylformimino-5-aminoimidazole carboxamide ribotide isomerase
LDLKSGRSGVPTLELCRAVRELSPDVEIITGGGVRGIADLEALERAGVDGVLIASALHDGSLTPEECVTWNGAGGATCAPSCV